MHFAYQLLPKHSINAIISAPKQVIIINMNSALKARIKHAKKNTKMGKKLKARTKKFRETRKIQY